MFKEGEIVAAKVALGIEHYGLVTECGSIISASMRVGCVAEESENVFSNGQAIISKGYPSNLPPHVVVSNARRSIGKKWNLIDYNCQHFATECHEQKHSPQLRNVVCGIGVIGLVFLLSRGKGIGA